MGKTSIQTGTVKVVNASKGRVEERQYGLFATNYGPVAIKVPKFNK